MSPELAGDAVVPDDVVAEDVVADEEAWTLVVPRGWAVAEVALERLTEATAEVGDEVVALGAPMSVPPPGTSGRVDAERSSMAVTGGRGLRSARLGDAVAADPYRGAVLVRSHLEVTVDRDGVRLPDGHRVVEVAGAVSHDPWQPAPRPADAVPEGRPPFPSRPVVLFLGLEDDLDQADAARTLANALQRNGVEGRLAVPEVPEGLLSAQPCAPTEATVRALRPEVVVVTDAAARDAAERWLAGIDRVRGTVLVELTLDTAMDVELVSWRIGEAQGRLRARVGPRVGSKRFAALVNRLVSGPQPEPPPEDGDAAGAGVAEAAVALVTSRARRRGRRRAVVVHPSAGPTRRSAGLAAHLQANGWVVESAPASGSVAPAERADLLVGDPSSLLDVLDLASPRGTAVVDLTADDVVERAAPVPDADAEAAGVEAAAVPTAPDLQLSAEAEKACLRAGAAVAASGAVLAAARAVGVRTTHLPDLYPQEVLERFATARREAVRDGDPVLGWVCGGDRPDPAVTWAIVRALEGLLDQGVLVEVVPWSDGPPDGLPAHPGLVVLDAPPAPERLAGWWGQVWAPGPGAVARTGHVAPVVEAGAAGVPTVAPLRALGPAAALVDPANLVGEATRAGAWRAAALPLLAASTRNAIRTAVHARVVALHGRQAGASAIGRFEGWLRYGEENR